MKDGRGKPVERWCRESESRERNRQEKGEKERCDSKRWKPEQTARLVCGGHFSSRTPPCVCLHPPSIHPISLSLCLFYLPHIKMHHGASQRQTRTPVKAQENDQQHEHSLSITSERLISRWLYCFGINIFKMPASSCQNGGFMLTPAWLI